MIPPACDVGFPSRSVLSREFSAPFQRARECEGCSKICCRQFAQRQALSVASRNMVPPTPRIPHRPKILEARVKRFGQWEKITIEQALETKEQYAHCPECDGLLR